MKKKAKVLLAVAIVALLSLGSFSTLAHAAVDPALPVSEAGITKVLHVPVNTEYPAMEFEFYIELISEDGGSPSASMPVPTGATNVSGDIYSYSLFFDGWAVWDATPLLAAEDYDSIGSTGPDEYYFVESGDMFGTLTYPHAGIYEYEITEHDVIYTAAGGNVTETDTLSLAAYTLWVYVAECGQTTCTHGPGNTAIHASQTDLYITHIGVVQTIKDDGTPGDDEKKLDPIPGGDQTNYFWSQVAFENGYVKTNGSITPDPDDAGLVISKEVDGAYGSTTKYFEFELELSVSTLIWDGSTPPAPIYEAIVVEWDSSIPDWVDVTDTDNGASAAGVPIDFVCGTPTTFYLKHGQYLIFKEIPVGTGFEVTEDSTSSSGYDAIIDVTINGTTIAASPFGAVGSPAWTPGQLYTGEAGNVAAYTNDASSITPTGINMTALPLIGLLGLFVLGFLGYRLIAKKAKGQKS